MKKGFIQYYISSAGENPVKDFIESLSRQQKTKVFRIFMHIEEYGLLSIIPHIKKLTGTPLWEIRILGKDNIRIFYATMSKDGIIVLHGFVKKSHKTPSKEIEAALHRYKGIPIDK